MRLLFLGDIVGRPGRLAVSERLPALRERWRLDCVVINGENAAGGFGITESICNELIDAGADAVCGTVSVLDWTPHLARLQVLLQRFHAVYTDADDHAHVHGANFGVSAEAYRSAGGFVGVACSEDVALVEALEASGARIAWSAAPRVVTSARVASKARGGFGDTLRAWSLQPPTV